MSLSTYPWRGAVEPAQVSPSGNEVQLWRGAMERILYSLTGNNIEVTTEITVPGLTITYPSIRRLFKLTGTYDPDVSLTGESN